MVLIVMVSVMLIIKNKIIYGDNKWVKFYLHENAWLSILLTPLVKSNLCSGSLVQ